MPLQIVETTVTPLSLKLVIANERDPALATERIEVEVPLHSLKQPGQADGRKIENSELQYLSELHRAALQYVREAVDTEIRRLREQANQNL